MTTNYEAAVAALDELRVKRADLLDEYENARRPAVIAKLNQDVRDASTRARSHSHLAIADAVREFREKQS